MAETTILARMLQRSDTKQSWEDNNPILGQGEWGIQYDTNPNIIKIGDGYTHWNDLPPMGVSKEYVDTKLSLSGGVMSGDIDMHDNKIYGIREPSFEDDVTTKKYVDDAVSNCVKADGSVPMTGNLNMQSDDPEGGTFRHWIKGVELPALEVEDLDYYATNKGYVDNQIFLATGTAIGEAQTYTDNEVAKKLDLTGGTVTGDLTVNGSVSVAGINSFSVFSASIYDELSVGSYGGTSIDIDHSGIDMKSNATVKNLKTPEENSDAATKGYVDDQLGNKLNITGGTLTGEINMSNNKIYGLQTPEFDDDAANKEYVDTKLSLSGGTLTGDLNLRDGMTSLHNITGLNDIPTEGSDLEYYATNKNYVDNQIFLATANIIGEAQTYTNNEVAKKLDLTGGTVAGNLTVDGSLTVSGINNLSAFDASFSSINVSGINIDGAGISMANNTAISNVAYPLNGNDAANKTYVDDSIMSVTMGAVQKSGDTMSGDLTVNGTVSATNGSFGSAEIQANGALVMTDKTTGEKYELCINNGAIEINKING